MQTLYLACGQATERPVMGKCSNTRHNLPLEDVMAEKWERLVRDLQDDVAALKKANRALEKQVGQLETRVKKLEPIEPAPTNDGPTSPESDGPVLSAEQDLNGWDTNAINISEPRESEPNPEDYED
jgi:hypothetical protein